jgi:hypothetical protein
MAVFESKSCKMAQTKTALAAKYAKILETGFLFIVIKGSNNNV